MRDSGPSFDLQIPFSSFRLANGLTVIVHENRNAPVVSVNIWYRVGSKDEPPGRSGFAHLFEHLMFSGSRHSPGRHIPKMLEVGALNPNSTHPKFQCVRRAWRTHAKIN